MREALIPPKHLGPWRGSPAAVRSVRRRCTLQATPAPTPSEVTTPPAHSVHPFQPREKAKHRQDPAPFWSYRVGEWDRACSRTLGRASLRGMRFNYPRSPKDGLLEALLGLLGYLKEPAAWAGLAASAGGRAGRMRGVRVGARQRGGRERGQRASRERLGRGAGRAASEGSGRRGAGGGGARRGAWRGLAACARAPRAEPVSRGTSRSVLSVRCYPPRRSHMRPRCGGRGRDRLLPPLQAHAIQTERRAPWQ